MRRTRPISVIGQERRPGVQSGRSCSSRARRTAALRRDTPSLRRMLRTCVRTVFTETNMASAISSVLEHLVEVPQDLELLAVNGWITSSSPAVGSWP